jgi:hypothetical protein
LTALEAFLRTVDTPEMVQYLQQNGSCIPNTAVEEARSGLTPAGVFVEDIDLSMLPHRWETVHIGHIQSLARGCPFISSLNLSDCVQLRDSAVQFIAEKLGPRKLTSLVLSGCKRITDLAILSLCTHAIRLETLELSSCDRISDISMLELGAIISYHSVPGCSSTLEQHASSSSNVALSSSQGMPRSIKRLDLSFCTRITDLGIRALRLGTGQQIHLNLEGCYGVLSSDEELDESEWEDLDDDADETQ